MKLLPNITLPAQLPPVSSAASSGSGMTGIDSRLAPSLPLPFSPTDLLWRYGPLAFSPTAHHPTSPFFDFKTLLPNTLASDPRNWSREDVATFLRWAEREFDLPQFDMDMFQMNGKALCLLTKSDLGERCPGAGDVLHNILNMLARDFNQLQRCLPGSPVTPTRPTASYPLSPHSHPPTPTWVDNPYAAANLASLMSANSVTLSPAPSVDSQAGSPGHNSNTETTHVTQVYKSDSDEDNQQSSSTSPPVTPTALTAQRLSEVCVKDERSPTLPPHHVLPLTPGGANYRPDVQFKRDAFFPSDSPEPTNGRLLWDFLQQLLNDPSQRYTHYIAWKSRETGVFKIVDPPGLARLWGIQKNHLSMNYDKMSRALRYYYRVNILRKVQGERHCYQFLRNPTELKNIKNISLLRQQMRIKAEPGEEETTTLMEPEVDMPTDLSMSSMNNQVNNNDSLKTPTSNGSFDIPDHNKVSIYDHAKHQYETHKSAFEPKSPFEHKSPYDHHHHHEYKSQFEPPQLQPLPLLDPPAKFRSHAYTMNLAKNEAQQSQAQQAQQSQQSQQQQQSQQMPPPQPMQIQQTQIIVEDRK